jgi:hypothetical protein
MISDEPSRRRPGRPALVEGDRSVYVTVAIPSKQYDDIYQQAQRQRLGVPEVIRRRLRDDSDE